MAQIQMKTRMIVEAIRRDSLRNCPFCNRRAAIKEYSGLLTIECNHRETCLIRHINIPYYPAGDLESLLLDWNGIHGGLARQKEDDLK